MQYFWFMSISIRRSMNVVHSQIVIMATVEVAGVVLHLQAKTKKKRRWSFGKSCSPSTKESYTPPEKKAESDTLKNGLQYTPPASEATIAPISKQSGAENPVVTLPTYSASENEAALKIQTAFRAYLVRKSPHHQVYET